MPSPFPGMDPFLEDPELWPDVHHGLISELQAQINRQLRPRYVARVELRVYLAPEEDPARTLIRVPDVKIESGPESSRRLPTKAAALTVSEPLEMTTMLVEDETEEAFLKVIQTETSDVVTVIEVVSPTNKVAGSEGRASYLKKRDEVQRSPAHWVEIDLLRTGKPTFDRGRLVCDYLAHVSRVERRPKGRVWPIFLRQRLPVISIPLRGDDPDAAIDLQEVLANVYERAAYDVSLDYQRDPIPPLGTEDAAWAAELLRGAGLRPSG
jgi:hypothetical protein